jgi:CrcB protein
VLHARRGRRRHLLFTVTDAETTTERALGLPAWAAVAAGGTAGTLLRYGAVTALPVGPGRFPWVIAVVNVVGAAAAGLASAGLPRRLRPLVASGFLGGFTTMSALAVDTDLLARGGHVDLAVAYAGASTAAGLAAAWLGVRLGARR